MSSARENEERGVPQVGVASKPRPWLNSGMASSSTTAPVDIELELKLLRLQLGELSALMTRHHRPAEAVDFVEAGRLLRFSSVSVRRLVANGTLRAVPIGARLRIPMSEIRALVVMGVPERSRWGKRLARPEPYDAAAEAEKLRVLRRTRRGIAAPPPETIRPPPPPPTDKEWEELRSIRAEVDELKAALEQVTAPVRAITLQEAARRLSLGKTTLRQLVAKRTVRAVIVGNRRMIPTSEVERLTALPPKPSASASDASRAAAREAERSARERERAWLKLKARGFI